MSFWDNVKKFAQPYAEDDYDDYDEDEYDDEYEGSFESVLEQMSSVLGQKMLKWH